MKPELKQGRGEDSGDKDGPLGQSQAELPLAILFGTFDFLLDFYWE